MSAKLYRIGVLIICFLQFTSFSVTAQVVEPGTTQEHLKPLEYFVGTWELSGMQFDRGVTGTMTFEWDLNKNILIRRIHTIPNDEPEAALTSMFVILWDAKNKRILERGYGGYGGYGQGKWTQTDQGWNSKGLGNWTLWNGEQTIHEASYIVKTKNECVFKATDQKEGEKEPFTTELTLTRVTELAGEDNSRIPWDWLLGHWNIESSDGKTSKVHWDKPDSGGDYLIGKWKHEDGSWLMEIVGWRPDSKTLTSQQYGSNGVYGEVNFTEFLSRRRMKGSFHRREANGKIVKGTVEVHRVQDDLVKSRMVHSDGTVVTETITRVSTTDEKSILRTKDEISKKVIKYFDSASDADLEYAESFFGNDVEVMINKIKVNGKKAYIERLTKIQKVLFKDMKFIDLHVHTNYFSDEALASNGKTFGDLRPKTIWSNAWADLQAVGRITKKNVTFPIHFDFRWENGKVVEMLAYYDPTVMNEEIAAFEGSRK